LNEVVAHLLSYRAGAEKMLMTFLARLALGVAHRFHADVGPFLHPEDALRQWRHKEIDKHSLAVRKSDV
jgi:hypothetical protein